MRYPTTLSDLRSSSEIEPGTVFLSSGIRHSSVFRFFRSLLTSRLPRNAAFYIDAGLSSTATQWLLAAKSAGAFGVDLFFALSAFLITELLRREYVSRGKFSLSNFYIRRALRIWPLYFTFLAATAIVIPRILPDDEIRTHLRNLVRPFLWQLDLCDQRIAVLGREPFVEHICRRAVLRWLAVVAASVRNEPHKTARHRNVGTRISSSCFAWPHLASKVLAFGVTHSRDSTRLQWARCSRSFSAGALRISTLRHRLLLCGLAMASWLLVARYLSKDGPTSLSAMP